MSPSTPNALTPEQRQAADAQAQANQTWQQAQLALTSARTATAQAAAQRSVDSATIARQNADTNAARLGIAQQNADTNASRANSTASNQAKALSIKQSANQALSEYQQGLLAAKGDANKIALAKAQYDSATKLIDAQVNQLHDEMQADTSLDANADSGSVTQADSRNQAALSATNNAATQVTDLTKLGAFAGNPSGAAGAMAGLMKAGAAMSNASGGAPVDPQQLTLQHKLQIADLVMNKGVSFDDAVRATATQAGILNPANGINGALPGDPNPVLGYQSPGNFPATSPSGFSVNPSSPSAEQAAGTYTGGR